MENNANFKDCFFPKWQATIDKVKSRGISFHTFLTCILCKTLEHIVASSITKHLSKLNIFYELQHVFMLVDDLFKYVYKKKQTDLILLDFSKA